MPASSTDSVSHLVGETLTATFAASGFGSGARYATTSSTCDLQQKLVSASKRILMKKIEFASGSKQSSFQVDSLRAKYTPLNSQGAITTNCLKNGNTVHSKKAAEPQKHLDGLPVPKVVLFPPERVKLEWPNVRRIGAGLENMGNTCFLNSVLQCLTYTAPLVNYIFSNEHSSRCKQNGFCMMCEIQRHIRRCLDLNGGVVRPYSIFHKLKEIARHLQYGRQEDAHEFLRYVVNAMQTSCLNGYAKLDKISRETTVVNQIFGGFLRSQVVCLRCKTHSNTYDPFLDISLDVKNVSSVPKAFERFVHPEMLDNDNAYSCAKCKQKVSAQKRFTIHRPSNVLTLQLKRFDMHRMFGKVTRHIDFPEKIDIRPYMSIKHGEAVMYQLYGVLVHQGMSSNSGHYYCYVKGSDRMWYTMNDNYVQQASLGRVLSAEAYLLFYIKQKPVGTNTVIGLKKPDLKPLPNNVIKHEAKRVMNGPTGEPAKELGVPISRPTVIPTPTKTSPASERKLSPLAGITQREKISFGIKPHSTTEKAVYSQKPRIVMHIKKGKVSYSSVSDKQSPVKTATTTNVVNRNVSVGSRALVPYNDDDDDSDTAPEKGVASSTSSNNHKEKKQEVERKALDIKNSKTFEPVFDKRLNTTMALPGAYGSLDKEVSWTGHDGKPLKNGDAGVSKALQEDAVKQKHMIDHKLTVQVDSSAASSKVNATTHWDIQHQEAEAPSSIGSCSSTGSINSTTKWQVTPQRCQATTDGPLSPLEVACVAGFTVKTRLDSTTDQAKLPPKNTTTPPTNGQLDTPVVMATGDHLPPGSSSHSSRSSSVSTSTNSVVCNKHPGSVKSSSVSAAGTSSSLPVTSTSSSVASSSSGSGRRHKHKKHKKHKREARDDEYEDDVPRKKKKKKKKHKRSSRNEPSASLVSDDDRSPDTIRHESDASPTTELVWVEKTKESIEREHKHHLVRDTDSKVPVQSWDEHLQRAPSSGSGNKEKAAGKTRHVWDGIKTVNTDVISELQKTSIAGYGPQVNSWDGGRSHVDDDIINQRREERKRQWSDEYEEQLDTGKTKKVCHRKQMDCTGDNNAVTFQKVQNYRNTVEKDRVNGTVSYSDPERSVHHSPRRMLSAGHHESKHHRHSPLSSDHSDHGHGSKHKVYH